eukprot:gene7923-biopygen18086
MNLFILFIFPAPSPPSFQFSAALGPAGWVWLDQARWTRPGRLVRASGIEQGVGLRGRIWMGTAYPLTHPVLGGDEPMYAPPCTQTLPGRCCKSSGVRQQCRWPTESTTVAVLPLLLAVAHVAILQCNCSCSRPGVLPLRVPLINARIVAANLRTNPRGLRGTASVPQRRQVGSTIQREDEVEVGTEVLLQTTTFPDDRHGVFIVNLMETSWKTPQQQRTRVRRPPSRRPQRQWQQQAEQRSLPEPSAAAAGSPPIARALSCTATT